MLNNDKFIHSIQLLMVLATAILLIIFANKVISPDLVFTSLVAGVGGLVGSRIASNGYVSSPPAPAATPSTVSQ